MKTIKRGNAVLYGDPLKFQTYESPGSTIQIRDNRPDKHRASEPHGIVATMQTLGGGFSTYQTHDQAKRLARKIVRLLNA